MNRNSPIGIGKISLPAGWFDWILYTLLFVLFLNIGFNKNFHQDNIVNGGEFWSDKGGYYIYLPATFIYGFQTENYPDNLDAKNSYGFNLGKESKRVFTKYTSGISFFILPFFLPTHLIATQFDLQPDGFSLIYHKMVVVAGIFYLILAMFILKSFLLYYFPRWLSYILPFIILLSTNLYFYGIDDVMMPHLYSFFLISLLLLTFKMYLVRQMKSVGLFIAIAFIIAFLVLIRPTNVFIGLILIFWDVDSWREIGSRIRHFLRVKHILIFLGAFILVFLPQSVYWHFISGNWVLYSYQGESFSNWNNPMIIPFWFSPLNGLFSYTPAAILLVFGIILMIWKRINNGMLLLVFFILYSYIFSSWQCWYFGGSFGCRVMIEFYALFAVALGYLIMASLRHKSLLFRVLLFLLIASTIYFNQRIFESRLIFTGGTWAWEDYKDQLEEAGIAHFPRNSYTYFNDFENISMDYGIPHSKAIVHSGTFSTYLVENMEYNCKYSRQLASILDHGMVEKVDARIWINPMDNNVTGSFFACEIRDKSDSLAYYKAVSVDDFLDGENKWVEVDLSIHIPQWIDKESVISFYIFNAGRSRFFVDDMVVKFE